jgi:hypothetical protein
VIRLVGQSLLAVVLAVGLAQQTTILWELWWTPTTFSASTKSAQNAQTAEPDNPPLIFSPPPITTYPQTLARPLFVDGRRPPKLQPVASVQVAARAAPPPPPRATLDRYRLLGVHIDNRVRRALIQTPVGLRAWVGPGDRIDGWVVVDVESDRAILSIQERRGELRLYPAAPGG